MIGDTAQFDEFITDHRWAVLTCLRRHGQPNSSFVAYARDGDTLLVSTPGFTFKRKAIAQDPRITLCITSNAEPFNFVSVEGDAQIETDNLVEDTRKVFNNIKDTGFDEPADLPAWLASQQRVIIRLKPKRVYGVIR